MLKDQWLLVSKIEDDEGLIWGFERFYDHEVNIRLRSATESEAWEKLAVLLGKEDKENVEKTVIEGLVIPFNDYENIQYLDVVSFESTLMECLLEYADKHVKITIEKKP